VSHEGSPLIHIGDAVAALRAGRDEVEILVDAAGTDQCRADVLEHALEHVGNRPHSVWVDEPGGHFDDIAVAHGLYPCRDLLRLAIDLPTPHATDLAVRPFRPGTDDEAWLRVNNRAFAWHREQGHLTQSDLDERKKEDWFDADGFLLHDIDGELGGFCWTKVHHDVEPPAGEIFAIAADPDAQGRGLGRDLVVAGLAYLAGLGLTAGMLYVDAGNGPARKLYDKLGFRIDQRRRLYLGDGLC
jgi:mycothiol synthase